MAVTKESREPVGRKIFKINGRYLTLPELRAKVDEAASEANRVFKEQRGYSLLAPRSFS